MANETEPQNLQASEDDASDNTPSSAETAELNDVPSEADEPSFYNDEDKKPGRLRSRLNLIGGKFNKKFAVVTGIASMALVMAGIAAIFWLLGSLKLEHFAQVLSTTGYARFNNILQERATQNIFDASLVEGEGSVPIKGRTLLDRFKFRNVDSQISALGRENKLKLILEDNNMKGVRTNGKPLTLDGLTNELGYGESFDSLSRARFVGSNPVSKAINWSKIMRVRHEFTARVQVQVGESLALEPRYIRSRSFGYIADGVGFKFGRLRQWGRNLSGKSLKDAKTEDHVEEFKETNAESKVQIEDGEFKGTVDQMKNADKLKAYLEKSGGTFDAAAFAESVNADIAKAAGMQENLSKVGTGALVASLVCMTNQTFAHADEIRDSNEAQAANMGLQFLAGNDQVRRSHVTSVGMAVLSSQLSHAEESAAYTNQAKRQNVAYNDNANVPRSKTNISPTLANVVKMVTSPSRVATGGLGGSDKIDAQFCNTLLSPGGMAAAVGIEIVGQAVIAFFSSGSGTLASEGGLRATAIAISKALADASYHTVTGIFTVKSAATLGGIGLYSLGLHLTAGALAGTTFSGAEEGAPYWERVTLGNTMVQDRQMTSVGGRQMTKDEARVVDKEYAALDTQRQREQNFFARNFSPHNTTSLTSMAVAYAPSSPSEGFSNMATSLGNVLQFSTFGRLAGNLFGGKVLAQTTNPNYDPYYDTTPKGFSSEELDKIRNDPAYTLAENELHISPEEITSFNNTIGQCFDPARTAREIESDPACAANNLKGDKVLHYRVYLLDKYLVESSEDDLAHPTEENYADPGAIGGTIDPNLPQGSAQELIDQIKATGNVTIAGNNEGLNPRLKRSILAVVLKLAQKYKFTITSTTRSDSGGGPHTNGSAVDIQNINGKGVPTGNDYAGINADADQFATDAATLLPAGNYSWMGVPNNHYKQIANNILRPKGGSSDLDVPGPPTWATGAHFHLNVPKDAP